MGVAADIVLGKYDDELDQIAEAIKERRTVQGRAAAIGITRGTRVRLKDDPRLKPTYLRGLTGKVIRKGPKNLVVDFDDKDAARRYAVGIRIPPEFVEVVT